VLVIKATNMIYLK